jgi:hypothetical protein
MGRSANIEFNENRQLVYTILDIRNPHLYEDIIILKPPNESRIRSPEY